MDVASLKMLESDWIVAQPQTIAGAASGHEPLELRTALPHGMCMRATAATATKNTLGFLLALSALTVDNSCIVSFVAILRFLRSSWLQMQQHLAVFHIL